ncbi:MAG: DUF5682 family protein [Hyphomicrobiaceae bacterium]
MSTAAKPTATLIPPVLEDMGRGVIFVPVRHHSPACAAALAQLMDELNPKQVLVEAPADFEPLLPVLLDAQTKPPVAIVAIATSPDKPPPATSENAPPERARAISYFPFCAYSPEYIALSKGDQTGARLALIDLPSSVRLGHHAAQQNGDAPQISPVLSFTGEQAFNHSAYVAALCRRTGMRDYNELWDHLFEQRFGEGGWRAFFHDVGTYCQAVRASVSASQMVLDGTLAREAYMADRLREALARPERPILVVTGGMHTPALIAALEHTPEASAPTPGRRLPRLTAPVAEPPPLATKAYVIRYGFRELDRLNGYAAGMPSPAYYQNLWDQRAHARWHALAAQTLIAFTAHLKADRRVAPPPLPAVANALEQSVRLADLRGHAGPSRQDLIDACGSSFLKTENTPGAAPILEHLTRFLTGDRIGDVPPSAGSPPLVESVREQARALGFDLTFASRKKRELDIYRNERHLTCSRFLHALSFLETGFANRLSGPDILGGHFKDILFETWTASWSPMVEARLIELSADGDELAVVAGAAIVRAALALEDTGQGRNGVAAVHLLLTACLIGQQHRLGAIAGLTARQIESDPGLASVVRAMSGLFLLWRSRSILGLTGAPQVEALIAGAFRRSLYLLDDIATANAERLPQILSALADLREVVQSARDETPAIDAARFDEVIERLTGVAMAPVLSGAVAALAYLAGTRDGTFLADRVRGGLNGAYLQPADKIAALNGVIAMARELLWRVPGLIEEIDDSVAGLDDSRFLECLPDLRLGFSALNPREIDEVACRVATRRGAAPDRLTVDVVYDISEDAVAANLALSLALRDQLTADGLSAWLPAEVTAPPRLPAQSAANKCPPLNAPVGPADVALRRWRLILGRYADTRLGSPQLTGLEGRCDGALGYLYDREYERRGLKPGGGDRHGSLDPSQLTALGWLGEVRDLFPASVCETIQSHALERYGMTDLLADSAFLSGIEPSAHLLGALLMLKGRADAAIQSKIRDLARRVVEDIMRRLKPRVESALSGTRNRFASSPMKSMRNFDWRATIRKNLKNYDAERGIIIAEHLRFHSRQKRRFPWTVVLCIDQSGSMTESVIYAAVMAAIISGLPGIDLKLVVFDTAVVDLTGRVDDPVAVLLSVQLGGGTDIGRAVTYCAGLINQPSRTVFVLVSDFCEGGSPARLIAAVRAMAEARVTMLGLAALDDRAAPDYDRAMAQRLADAGMKIAALTPEHFADWLAGVIS